MQGAWAGNFNACAEKQVDSKGSEDEPSEVLKVTRELSEERAIREDD